MQKEFGYARVSTAHQREDRQIQRLLEYGVEERNIMIDKQSGKDFDRIGYISLKQNMLRSGDTLVITELDRLGRNKAMIKSELEWFKSEGIRVKILNVPTTLLDCGGQDWVLDMVSNILIECGRGGACQDSSAAGGRHCCCQSQRCSLRQALYR